MGDPWAGQERLRLSDWAKVDPMIVSVLMENLGFDPPIGSTICYALLLINVGRLEWVTPELDRKGKTVESHIKNEKIQ